MDAVKLILYGALIGLPFLIVVLAVTVLFPVTILMAWFDREERPWEAPWWVIRDLAGTFWEFRPS